MPVTVDPTLPPQRWTTTVSSCAVPVPNEAPVVIARRWRVWARPHRADEVRPYLWATGAGDALATAGNLGAVLLHRRDGDEIHFELTTFWLSMDAVHTFAGPDVDRAVLYPDDVTYFTRWDQTVEHFIVDELSGLAPVDPPTW